MAELRRLLPRAEGGPRRTLPFGLPAIDACLPDGGLPRGALHEIVPDRPGATPAAFGFIAAVLSHLPRPHPVVLVLPTYGLRDYGRPYGHGLRALGLDPAGLIVVETAHRRDTLWAMEEALHAGAPAAVAGFIDKLDLRLSQRLQLAAVDAGLPLFVLRPAALSGAGRGAWGEASAAATRWRVAPAKAARDRFGLMARARWHLLLERCRNGRNGEWMVEYDHVAHRFSLAAALADPAFSRGAGERPAARAGRA